MMKKLMFLGAGAAGYVLGAKAGRERYEQIAAQAQKLRTNPTVQKKMDDAKHVAKDAAGTAAGKAAGKVREHVPGGSSGASSSTPSTPLGSTGANTFGVGDEGA
ncbi:MAG TPA: hypothetical protein VK204_16245 [Nocardioidaceae bacterium]|nr:hypothetical protein [Nocardioidaceae bacterium]